jgi:FkbM family methyltransferase
MRIPLIDNLLRRLGRARHTGQVDLAAWEAKHRLTIQKDLERVWPHLPDELRFVDVGANIGLFSEALLGGRPSAQGWLFEPVSEMYERCRTRFEGDDRVRIQNFALSDEVGEATIYKARYNPGGNSLVHELMYDTREVSEVTENPGHREESIRMEVFDEFATKERLDAVHFIKTDCEGFDHRVLQGMLGFIEACNPRPVILSEFMSEEYHPFWEDQKAVIEQLYGLGYQELDLTRMGKVDDYLLLPG